MDLEIIATVNLPHQSEPSKSLTSRRCGSVSVCIQHTAYVSIRQHTQHTSRPHQSEWLWECVHQSESPPSLTRREALCLGECVHQPEWLQECVHQSEWLRECVHQSESSPSLTRRRCASAAFAAASICNISENISTYEHRLVEHMRKIYYY
jgi:hypothetical protein